MQYLSYLTQDSPGFGVLHGDRIAPLADVTGTCSLREALARWGLDGLNRRSQDVEPRLALSDVSLLPPLPDAGKILCIGLNYVHHAEEAGLPIPTSPSVFMRWSGAQVGHGQPIVLPVNSSQFDYEAELAVVIGKAGRHICTARAFEHVAGYSCFGDHSLRDFQRHTAQATPGKNFDRSGAFGPWLISTDEVPDPQALEVIGRLNGEEVQRDSVSHMIFSIPELIAYLSSFCELQPGDVIATGTPAGVALGRQPPRWMTVGDRFEIEIPGVGRLANTVVPEPSTPSFYDKT